jgi:hypothetical protein
LQDGLGGLLLSNLVSLRLNYVFKFLLFKVQAFNILLQFGNAARRCQAVGRQNLVIFLMGAYRGTVVLVRLRTLDEVAVDICSLIFLRLGHFRDEITDVHNLIFESSRIAVKIYHLLHHLRRDRAI